MTAATHQAAALVYITCPTIDEAETIGRELLERRLVACVNILPGVVSLYRWKGDVTRDSEIVMIAKTRLSLAGQVTDAVRKIHSYETPAITIFRAESVEKNYLDWIFEETAR